MEPQEPPKTPSEQPPNQPLSQPYPSNMSDAQLSPPQERLQHNNRMIWIVAGVTLGLVVIATVIALFAWPQRGTPEAENQPAVSAFTLSKHGSTPEGYEVLLPKEWNTVVKSSTQRTPVSLNSTPVGGNPDKPIQPSPKAQSQIISAECNTVDGPYVASSFYRRINERIIPNEKLKNGATVSDEQSTIINGYPAYVFTTKALAEDPASKTGFGTATYHHAYYLTSSTEVCSLYTAYAGDGADSALSDTSNSRAIIDSFRRL